MEKENIFAFVEYVNGKTANSNEYSIVRAIVGNIDVIMNLTLEDLAHEAAISKASASRFIKKMGFESFYDFKLHLHFHLTNISKYKSVVAATKLAKKSDEQIAQTSFLEAQENLATARANFDLAQIRRVVELLKGASDVTFIGDTQAQATFYLVQLDLLSLDIPCYNFFNCEFTAANLGRIQEDSVLVYLALDDQRIRGECMAISNQIPGNDQGAKRVAIGNCGANELFSKFDEVVDLGPAIGTAGSRYSLLLIANIISDLLYK